MFKKDLIRFNKLKKDSRKLIYRSLPISVVIMMIFVFTLGCWLKQPVKTVGAVNTNIAEAVVIPFYSNQLYAGTYQVLGMLKIHLQDATAGKLQTITVKGDDNYNLDLAAIALFLDGTACGVGADDRLDITTDYVFPVVSGFTGGLATFNLSSDGCQMRDPNGATYFVVYALNSNDFTDFEGKIYTAQVLQNGITSSRGLKSGPTADSAIATFTIDTLSQPVLQSFTSTTADGTYGPGSQIKIYANYDKVIADTGSNLGVTLDNGVSVVLNQVSGKSIWGAYAIGPTGSGEDSGDLSIASIDSESVTDIYGLSPAGSTILAINTASQNLDDNSAIVIDTTTPDAAAPVLLSFTSTTANATYGWGDVINITATYNELLDPNSSLTVRLDNSSTVILPDVVLNNVSGATISGNYQVGYFGDGENVVDLTLDSITASTVTDRYGNTLGVSAIPGGNNFGDSNDIAVQIDAPIMGQSENVQIFDSNNNGFFDKVTFEIQNPNNETWTLNGSSPYGLSVIQNGITPMDVWSITIIGDPDADVINIEIFSITDSGFIQDTDGVNTNPLELIYVQGGADSITSVAGGFELNTIGSGDNDEHDTEIDKAAPIFVSAEYKDINSDGQIDNVDVAMTENSIVCSAFNAADWSFPTWEKTPGVFVPLINDVNITGFTNCSVVGGNLRFTVSGTLPGVTGGDTIGNTLEDRTPPRVSYTNNVNAIKDILGNVTTSSGFLSINDAAPPVPISAEYKSYSGNDFKISIDPVKHNDYGLAYPVTYEFGIPAGSAGLKAFKRYTLSESWTQLTEKTSADFFNGIETVRFDYPADKAYVSVSFGAASDDIYIKITDATGLVNISALYEGISLYYDNRDAAVVATADDWGHDHASEFITASNYFRSVNMWLTVGIIPNYHNVNPLSTAQWGEIQNQLDLGNIEPACHGYSHAPWFNNLQYDIEIGNCKTVILSNLDLPALNKRGSVEYLPAYIDPFGNTNPDVRQKIGQYKYLADRSYASYKTDYAAWDTINNTFKKTFLTLNLGNPGAGDALLYESFLEGVILSHGIIDFAFHPAMSYSVGPVEYIKNRKNLWYTGFGHLYMYRYVATQGDINVEAMDNKVDTVIINMSYDTGLSATYNAADWFFPRAGAVNITGISGSTAVNNKIILRVTGTLPNITSGLAKPQVSYVNSGNLVDAAANAVVNFSALSINDGILPVIYPSYGMPPASTSTEIASYPQELDQVSTPAAPLPKEVKIGDLIKSKKFTTIYFVGADNKRHAFTDEKSYFNYYPDFYKVIVVADSILQQIPLGKNVTVRPGTALVKIESDPKVYAVEPYGVLRYITTTDLAQKLYGKDWASMVIDISPAFFIDYQVGSQITLAVHPTESVIKYNNDSSIYYIENGKKRYISSEVFASNLFRDKYVLRDFDQSIVYPDGPDLITKKIEEIFSLR